VKRPHSDSSTPSLEKQQPKKKTPGTLKCRLGCIRKLQQYSARKDLPGHRHGKLFRGRPCKKRADDLLELSRHQLKMVVVILTGHVPVWHLYIMGLFNGDPTCRFCRRLKQCSILPAAAARCWLVSTITSLGSCLPNQKI
jgi:hypothetical protein